MNFLGYYLIALGAILCVAGIMAIREAKRMRREAAEMWRKGEGK